MNFSGINSEKRFWLPAVICLQVLIFIADVITPCDQADWNWNFLPLILSVWFGGRVTTYGLAMIGSVSILLAFYLSPPSGLMDLQLALDSRLVGVGLFWICALLVNIIKNTKLRLQRSERALLMISECDQVIVRATEEAELLRAVCDAIVNVGGYQMAWVGFAEKDERKSVRVVAAAGQQKAYLDDVNISWDEKNERGRGAIGIALRSGQPEIIRDLLHDLRMAPWHKRAAECGLKSAIALPLKSFDANFGTLMLYADEVDAFSAREVKLLTELVGDLAFGVQNLRTRGAQKAAESELQASEERYRKLVENARDLIFIVAPDGTFISVNPVVELVSGLGVDHWIGKPFIPLVHPDDLPLAWEMFYKALNGENIPPYELRGHPNLPQLVSMEITLFARKDAHGANIGVMGIGRDITARKQVEASLEQSHSLLRATLESTADGILVVDMNGKTSGFNQKFLELWQIPPALAKKLDDRQMLEFVVTQLAEPEKFLARVGELYANPEIASSEELLFKDGRVFERYSQPQRMGDTVVGRVWSFRDVTTRKKSQQALIESQENLQTLIDSLPDNVIMKDGEGRWLVANPPALQFFRLGPKAWLGRTDTELAELNPPLKDLHEACIRSDEIGWAAENTTHVLECGPGLDGKLQEHEVTKVPLFDADGKRKALLVIGRDVTQTKQLQQSLRLSELMSRQSRDALLLIRQRDGQIFSANEAALQMYGFSQEQILAKTIRDLRSKDATNHIAAQTSEAFAHGVLFETVHRDKSGAEKPVEVSSQGFNFDGEYYLVSAVRDITERKKIQSQLEVQRKFLVDLVENSPVAVFVKDQAGRCIMTNQAFMGIIGRKREEIIGHTTSELFPGLIGEQFRQKDLEIIARGSSQTYEEFLPDENGKNRTFLTTKFPMRNESGEVTGICGMTLEITKLKSAEDEIKRLATVVEQTVEGIFITNLAGAIIYANPAFEKITGYSRTEVIGKNPRLLKSNKHSAKFYNEMWETLKRGETWKGHFTNRRKDGSLYEEDAVITPIRDGGGTIVSYVAVKHDVTRELQLEAQFRQAQKMEAIGTLAGGIAHDFNNILMAIFVYGGMLKNDLDGQKESVEMVEQIVNSANRAKELVQQILTFSRQQEQKRQIIRLESVIKEASKFLRASLPVDIQMELNLSTEAPAVLADPTQIYQVVMNLATNAAHAMEGKPGHLTISLDAFTPDQALLESNPKFQPISYARLTTADTGQGMDAKTLERIFEPFFTTKGVGKGTGLGLAVVHGIALSHDAVITVESEIGKGTSISLYFPAQKLENDSATQNIRDLPLGNGQNILVVDDEAPLATMFERLLKLLHYRPTVCTNPLQALALFKNNPDQFDLVVTDLAMPEMNGLELAGEIRAIREKIPVVMISGFITPETREDYRKAGIRELLQKPAAITDVAQVLQRNLT